MIPTTLPLTFSQRPQNTAQTERVLLMLGGAFILLSGLALAILRDASPAHLLPLLVWTLCAALGHLQLERALPRRDPVLFPLVMFLSGWGLVLIDRLAPFFADRQALWLGVATAALLTVASLPQVMRWLRQYRYTLLVGGLLLLISTILLGQNPSGDPFAPRLWLVLPTPWFTVSFQPSEALKIVLVAFLASYLSEQFPAMRALGLERPGLRQWFAPRILGPIVFMWGLTVVVLIWQRDLGTALIFFAVFMTLLYVASGYASLLMGGALLTLVAGVVGYVGTSLVQLRIDIWLNPWPEADGRAYQIVQSLMAFAEGGVFGQGIGQGIPGYIPLIHSDFIFAALAEEWGLLGVLSVLACFSVLVARGLRNALRHTGHPFYVLLGVGLTLLIAVQSLLIMGGVLKLVPLTGVTLPFMSYGGSSLVMSFVVMGLLLRLSAGET